MSDWYADERADWIMAQTTALLAQRGDEQVYGGSMAVFSTPEPRVLGGYLDVFVTEKCPNDH